MDRIAEKAMIEEGFDKERLVITGNPYFDDLVEMKDKFGGDDRKKVRKELGVDPESYLLLYASQPLEHHYGDELGYTEKTVLRELLDSLVNFRDEKVELLVKVHPRENKSDLEEIVKEYDLSVVVDQNYPTRPAILASDVVIASTSTVLV